MQIFEGNKARWNDGRKRNRREGTDPEKRYTCKSSRRKGSPVRAGASDADEKHAAACKNGKEFFQCLLSIGGMERIFFVPLKAGSGFQRDKNTYFFQLFSMLLPSGCFYLRAKSLRGCCGHSGPSDFWELRCGRPGRRGLILLARVPGRWRHRLFPSSLP